MYFIELHQKQLPEFSGIDVKIIPSILQVTVLGLIHTNLPDKIVGHVWRTMRQCNLSSVTI